MTQYRTYIDSGTAAGLETIQSIQTNGTDFGIGISTDVVCNNISAGIITATAFYGNGSGLTGIIGTGGTGIGTTGSINTTGIITASQFYGVGLPQNLQTSSYTLSSSDAGKHVAISTGGVTLNTSAFKVGDAVTIYNNSQYVQGITVGSGVTMRRVSIGDTGSRGLNGYGLATILCIATNSYIISGAGVT